MFHAPRLTIQGLAYLTDTSGHRRNSVKSSGPRQFQVICKSVEVKSIYLRNSQILTVTDLNSSQPRSD